MSYVPGWVPLAFDSSFSRSYTSATIASDASITQVSILTVANAEVPGGVVVTTRATASPDGTATFRMMVNGSEVNAEFVSSAITSVMTIVPTSATSANVHETFASGSGSEAAIYELPWTSSINTISCECYEALPSLITLSSSRATAIADAIYTPTWGEIS